MPDATPRECAGCHTTERYANGKCIACSHAAAKRYRAAHPEEMRTVYRVKSAKRRAKSPDKYRAKENAYGAANREKRREATTLWRAKNRERVRVHHSIRRARENGAEGSHTADEVAALLLAQRSRCAYCRCSIQRGWHADHIVPLSKGGSNRIRNIQLLCQPCNQRKHAKDPLDYARERGLLL